MAQLFDSDGALRGGRCAACGYTFFPMQYYGCEECGSVDLAEYRLVGRGRLASFATVFVHRDPALPAPSTIGSVELDDGVTVRAIVEAPVGTLAGGEPLKAVVTNQQLRFRVAA